MKGSHNLDKSSELNGDHQATDKTKWVAIQVIQKTTRGMIQVKASEPIQVAMNSAQDDSRRTW